MGRRCRNGLDHGEFLHPAPDLRVGHRHHHGAGRRRSAISCCRSRSFPTSRRRRSSSAPTIPAPSAQVVADTVTTPLEQQINGVAGMTYMSSSSSNDGSSNITVTFDVGYPLSIAAVDVQNRVSQAASSLPADRQSGRRDDQEAEPELRPDRQSHLAGRFGRSGRAQQLRLSAGGRSAEAPARASATCRSSASGAIRCASGSIPTGSPISASPPSTCRTPSPSRTSRSRPARSASRRRRTAPPSRCRSTPSAG